MKSKKNILVVIIGLFLFLPAIIAASEMLDSEGNTIYLSKAAPRLENYLSSKEEIPEMIPVYLILTEQYDAHALYEKVRDLPKPQRRKYTVETLKQFSSETQSGLRKVIDNMETTGDVTRTRYLWISNVIGLEATYEALMLFDRHPDIYLIEHDPPQKFLEEYKDVERNRRKDERSNLDQQTREITYNVQNVNAPEVWELGVTGEGALVAVIDSGVNYNHNDIRNQMWEHPDFPNHGYNFWDDNLDPMDNQGHGTHCAGTVAGNGTSGSQTGMAPDATIMALKPLHGFTGQHQTFWHAVQFAVEYEADILSVSMYWRHTLIDNVTRATFRTIMVNTLSAGVVMAKSAGNDGTTQNSYPIPYNVNIPSGSPPPWLNPDQQIRSGVSCVIAVGAIDSNNNIASWSSRGPVTWRGIPGWDDYHYNPGPGLIKPDIVAGGVNVKSLLHSSNTAYTHKSGTSMAAPGVAGVLALMVSKNPYLTPERISQIIEETAVPYTDTKSNTYGAGRIDALAAVLASSWIGVKEVTVTDDNNNLPEYGETVDLNISLINIGEAGAAGMSGILSTDDEYIEIVSNFAEFGAIEVDSVVIYNEAYTITISGATPHNHKAVFDLVISSDDDRVWNNRFALDIYAPVIVVETVRVTGDNSNMPEYGSTVNLSLGLHNSGGSEARALSAILTSEDEYITIIEDEAVFADIDVDETVFNTDFYTISIANDAPHLHKAAFNLRINGEGGQNWNRDFYIEVQAPYLTVEKPFIYDPPPGGNNNGLIDPGEELLIYLPLLNTGGTLSPEVEIDVTVDDDFIEILSIRDSKLTSVAPGEIAYPALYVRISENAEAGHIFSFQYSLSTGEYLFEENFMLGVGDAIQIRLGEGVESNTESAANPINIYFRSLRSQAVYTAEEIRNTGITAGGLITQLGYYVEQTPANVLPNWLIRMKHTTNSNAAQHIEGPYSEVYFAQEYAPQAGGWDMLVLDTEFEWNGVDNILVDTAFSTAAGWSSSGRTRIYEVNNGFRFSRADYPDQRDVETNTANSDKPQLMLTINTTPGADIGRPRNLTVRVLSEAEVHLQWRPPIEARTGGSYSDSDQRMRRSKGQGRQQLITRNPDGYNVYRNGIRVNEELVPHAEFMENHDPTELMQFYYVTAVYEYGESLPSNVITTGFVSEITSHPVGGLYYEPVEMKLSSDTPGADIHYTLDGSNPDENSPIYTEPLKIDYFTVVKATAFRENWMPSETKTITYHILYAPDNLAAQVRDYNVFLSWDEPWAPSDERQRTQLSDKDTKNNDYHRETSRVSRQNHWRSILPSLHREYLLGYNVYRAAAEDSFAVVNEELLTDRQYADRGLAQGIHRYYVTAVYEPGESKASEIINVNSGETGTDDHLLPLYQTKLYNAYPNPFNPATTISFSLKESEHVGLEIYNIAGQRIITLIDEKLEPGMYEVVWQGKDDNGRRTGSGIYFYRFRTSGYEEVKKAVLLK